MTRTTQSTLLASLLLLAGCGGADIEPAAPVADIAAEAGHDPSLHVEGAEASHDPSHHVATAATETTQPAADGWITYGQALTAQAPVASSAVITTPADYVGKVIKVQGAVAQVCQSAGCWLSFTHEGKELTVNMKDHAFAVDKKSAGSWCEAEGELKLDGESLSMTASAVRMKPTAAAAGAVEEAPTGESAPEAEVAPSSKG